MSRIKNYRQRAQDYFARCDAANALCGSKEPLPKPYTLSGLLCELELTKKEFYSLAKNREGKRFVNYALMKIEAFIEENALSGRLSSKFAENSLRYCLGWGESDSGGGKSAMVVSLDKEAEQLGQ